MRRSTRIVFAFGAGLLATGSTGHALAQRSGCFARGDIVTFDGVASADAGQSQWVLNLPRPVCVESRAVSAIRIIGTPPPLGVPLQLTGKLVFGKNLGQTTMFAALSVIRGRKTNAGIAVSAPPPPPRPLVSLPPRPVAHERCDAPPYGGTGPDYAAFVRRFEHIIRPQKILAGICNAKFGHAPRDGLHKLGFTDARIDAESTEHLAGDTIGALKNLVNTIE